MADPTPSDPPRDADKSKEPAGVPTLWHDDKPLDLPDETATPRRAVFLWLLGFLLLCAVLISVMIWLRPAPKPTLASAWLSNYQYQPFQTPPFARQDQASLTAGKYFSQGVIPLKAIDATAPADTLVVYVSGHAICDELGAVHLLPIDADPSMPQGFRTLKSVLTSLKNAPAQKKLLVLDLGWPLDDPYWGDLDVGVAARLPDELAAVEDAGRLVLTSCGPGQVPLASPELGRSVFSYFFEEGLRGWADVAQPIPERQGIVSAHRLAAYVQARVSDWAVRHHATRQTPTLYGDVADFPLLALARGKPLPHLERASVPAYPAWLTDAWKTREAWRSQERHRDAPWLFRQADAAIAHAERGWQNGVAEDDLKKEIKSELERVDKYYQRIAKMTRPVALSVAPAKLDPAWVASVKELFKKVVEVRASVKAEEADKASGKVIDEFVDKHKAVSDAEWAAGIFEVTASDPFPRRDLVRLADRLLELRKSAARHAEADMVQRLARLAESFDEVTWPVALVRKSLELTQIAEQAALRPRSYRWFASVLEKAAQKRHDAEVLLFARGYVTLAAVETPLNEALREYESLAGKQEIVEEALRSLQDATLLLPGYSVYVDHFPALEPAWHDAARTTLALQALLTPPAGPIDVTVFVEEVRTQAESLNASMRQLRQAHAPEVLDDLITRAQRPDADARVYRELLAQWTAPVHVLEVRAKLWEARGKLGARLTAKILDTENRESAEDIDASRDVPDARAAAAARSARSLALLRLAGLEAEPLLKLEEQHAAFVALKDAANDQETRDGHALAFGLRQAWAQTLPQRTATALEVGTFERVSRIAPGWVRLGAKEEALAGAAMIRLQESQRLLWTWQADRARYASQEPDATPFTTRAAFALRDFAPKQTEGVSLPTMPSVAPLNPMKPTLTLNIPLAWRSVKRPATFHAPGVNEEWLQVQAEPPSPSELPVQVSLKPQAELSPSPRPLGFLFGVTTAGRTYHHKVQLPGLPVADRLEIIVSASPKEVGIPLGDLRLRPSKDRHPFYVYLNNLADKTRTLTVELHAADRVLPGGSAVVVAPPRQAVRAVFGALPTPVVKEPVLPTKEAPAVVTKNELPELIGPLHIRVFEKDRPQEPVLARELRVGLAPPREYVRVPTIRFEPASEANKKKNRLDVTVQAARKLGPPPCLVELVVPIERIPGLRAVRTGTFRGELPDDGKPLQLSATELDFDPYINDTGIISLTVDGVERALLFRTTFAPVGEPTTPREELRPMMHVSAGRYYRTNTRFEPIVEVDNAPAAAQLLVSLGQLRGEPGKANPLVPKADTAFEAEVRHPALPPRQKRIGAAVRADGGVEFDTLLRDWRVPFDAVPLRGERVVQARLVDADGKDVIPPVYHRVLFDDHLPEQLDFVNLPKQAKRDYAYRLKATGVDRSSGIKEVGFYMGKPTDDGKPPQGVPRIDAKPAPGEPNVWQAIVQWPMDKKGFIDVSVQFTNNLGLSAFARGTVELVDFEPEKNAQGVIEGVVVEGVRPQTGVAVVLYDAKGNKVAEQKTQEGGVFAFPNVPPGQYVVRATKPTSGTPLTATSKVNLAPGKTERLKMELYL